MGLGTWLSKPGEVSQAVAVALKSGYKHIDCAAVYQNEPEVRAGLKEAFDTGIKREGIFSFTSVHTNYRGCGIRCASLVSKLILRYFYHIKAMEYFSQTRRRHSKLEKNSY